MTAASDRVVESLRLGLPVLLSPPTSQELGDGVPDELERPVWMRDLTIRSHFILKPIVFLDRSTYGDMFLDSLVEVVLEGLLVQIAVHVLQDHLPIILELFQVSILGIVQLDLLDVLPLVNLIRCLVYLVVI